VTAVDKMQVEHHYFFVFWIIFARSPIMAILLAYSTSPYCAKSRNFYCDWKREARTMHGCLAKQEAYLIIWSSWRLRGGKTKISQD
jgi:hypothetical protein